MNNRYDSLFHENTALVIVDMVNGFLTEGPLSSPRSAAVLPACEALLQAAKDRGLPVIAFADCHEPDCIEFASFPPTASGVRANPRSHRPCGRSGALR